MLFWDPTFVADHRVFTISTETLVWWKDVFEYVYTFDAYKFYTSKLWCGVVYAHTSYLSVV